MVDRDPDKSRVETTRKETREGKFLGNLVVGGCKAFTRRVYEEREE